MRKGRQDGTLRQHTLLEQNLRHGVGILGNAAHAFRPQAGLHVGDGRLPLEERPCAGDPHASVRRVDGPLLAHEPAQRVDHLVLDGYVDRHWVCACEIPIDDRLRRLLDQLAEHAVAARPTFTSALRAAGSAWCRKRSVSGGNRAPLSHVLAASIGCASRAARHLTA